MYNEENGLYEYGPKIYYNLDNGEIFYFAWFVQSSDPYWEVMNPFEWPPFVNGGHTPENTGLIEMPFDPENMQPPGNPVRVVNGEIEYEPFPEIVKE